MFLAQFDSLLNRDYNIQYSSDLLNWRTVYPSISGIGSRIEWADSGPPATATFPASQPTRFYRVMLLP